VPRNLRVVTRPDFDPNRTFDLVDTQVTGPPSINQYDIDHDGKIDTITYDLDGDGQTERTEVDEDGDGRIDTIYVSATHPGEHAAVYHDYDHDGKFENVWMDTNADGKIDEIRDDSNEDGHPEKVQRDSDFNGSFDWIVYDDNSDGEVDRIAYDSDGDGNPDRVVPSVHVGTVHTVGTNAHLVGAQGTSDDTAFGAGEAAIDVEGLSTFGTTVSSLGDAPGQETFGEGPHDHLVQTVGEAPHEHIEASGDPQPLLMNEIGSDHTHIQPHHVHNALVED
jgi:hypothetical protein